MLIAAILEPSRDNIISIRAAVSIMDADEYICLSNAWVDYAVQNMDIIRSSPGYSEFALVFREEYDRISGSAFGNLMKKCAIRKQALLHIVDYVIFTPYLQEMYENYQLGCQRAIPLQPICAEILSLSKIDCKLFALFHCVKHDELRSYDDECETLMNFIKESAK